MKNNVLKDHAFLQHVGYQQLLKMFDLIPDIIFWIKDQESRFIYVNQHFANNVGVKSPEQLIGKTDFDCTPKHIAEQFLVDDKKVMQGEVITDRLELNIEPGGDISWFSTSKRPVLDEDMDIIGSYGITHKLNMVAHTLSDVENISAPIKYIRAHFHDDIKVSQLAEIAHLSVSALERRFKKYLFKTPKQFINQTRLEHARKLLIETNLPVSEIAFQSGFSEPSYFSKQYKILFCELPSETRNHHHIKAGIASNAEHQIT